MLNKIATVILGFILVIGISLMLWEHFTTLTFGEVTNGLLASDESIEQVVIIDRDPGSSYHSKEAHLSGAFYDYMLERTSYTKLKEQDGSTVRRYFIEIKTDQGNQYPIYISERDIQVKGQNYEVVGENHIVYYIDSTHFDWE
ncbi:hypothetical protein [Oceanobacillus manasiensis]|uniref:hypothetical protein n=1 Tax=Oceanobacillus manasiensis TaxID=586413 RepID=UPI0005AA3328|nr:hypothetical protein [Oceanobacillus manasiensis]